MRVFLETIREQQYAVIELAFVSITRGQLLTIPLFLGGLGLLLWSGLAKR